MSWHRFSRPDGSPVEVNSEMICTVTRADRAVDGREARSVIVHTSGRQALSDEFEAVVSAVRKEQP